jgi:hypothetical protein
MSKQLKLCVTKWVYHYIFQVNLSEKIQLYLKSCLARLGALETSAASVGRNKTTSCPKSFAPAIWEEWRCWNSNGEKNPPKFEFDVVNAMNGLDERFWTIRIPLLGLFLPLILLDSVCFPEDSDFEISLVDENSFVLI